MTITILALTLCLLLFQVQTESVNQYPNCSIIDIVNKVCLKCSNDSFELAIGKCTPISNNNQIVFTPNVSIIAQPSTSIFYNQPTNSQQIQPSSQNLAGNQIPAGTTVTTSMSSQTNQGSNIANIISFLSTFAANNQNTQQIGQSNSQTASFLSNLTQNSQQSTPNLQISSFSSSSNTQKGTYSDINCKQVDQAVTRCIKCYPSYYFNNKSQKCEPVNPLCNTYTDQNQCTSCYIGYSLSNATCVINPNYKPSSGGSARDDNCKGWMNGTCVECYSSYYYSTAQKMCKSLNPLCKSWNKEGACTSCYSGYTLQTNLCIITKDTTKNSNSNTNTQNVMTSSTISSIQNSTSTSATVSNMQTNTIFSQLFGSGFSTSPNNCLNIGNNLLCPYGSFILQFALQNGQTNLVNVIPISNQQQSQVSTSSSNTGIVANPVSNTVVASNTNQKSSSTSLPPSNSISTSTSANLKNLAPFSTSSQGTTSLDPYCTSYYNNFCQGCKQGAYLTPQGCIPSTNQSVQNTGADTSSNTSSTCYYRQVRINGVCVEVSDDCKGWDQSGKCTDCFSGYLLLNGNCIRK